MQIDGKIIGELKRPLFLSYWYYKQMKQYKLGKGRRDIARKKESKRGSRLRERVWERESVRERYRRAR